MQIILCNLSLSLLEILFLAVVPILLIITGIAYAVLSLKQINLFQKAVQSICESVKTADTYTIKNMAHLKEAAENTDYTLLSEAVAQLAKSGEKKYQGKWLPDLSESLNIQNLSSKQLKSVLNYTPALLVFSCSFISSIIMAVLPAINPNVYKAGGMLTVLPVLIGILISLFLLNHKNVLTKTMTDEIDLLNKNIEQVIPVYSDKAGLSLLVNQMTEHENKIDSALTSFNQQLEQFVSDDFRDSLNQTILEVMEKEIAPPIKQAAQTLGELATALSEQQNQGMAKLADRFTENLHTALKNHFSSITKELSSFNVLMEDTSNFIHDSIAILENSRQQNILLNREVSESIELMTVAKNDIANEMAKMSDYLEVIANVTEKMTSVYAGEDANLKQQIGSLEIALNHSLNTINESIYQSQSTISLSSQLKEEQQLQYKEMLKEMNALLKNLNTLNQSIHDTTGNFATESEQLIKNSLTDYENALADIVERLIYTTAEIKDAVEALPLALNAKPNYFEKK